jgi:hypothetical protein
MTEQELRATMLAAILAQGIPMTQAVHDAESAVAYVMHGPGTAAAPRQEPHGEKRGRILDMWAAGASRARIVAEVGTTPASVQSTVIKARAKGDPRAVRRHKAPSEARLAALRACAKRAREARRAR